MMDYNFRNQQQRNLSKLTQLQIVQFFYRKEWGKTVQVLCTHWIYETRNYLGNKCMQKMIEATHLLWTNRNVVEHYRQIYGLREVGDARLKMAIKTI